MISHIFRLLLLFQLGMINKTCLAWQSRLGPHGRVHLANAVAPFQGLSPLVYRKRLDTRLFEQVHHRDQKQRHHKKDASSVGPVNQSPPINLVWNQLSAALKASVLVATIVFGLVFSANGEEVMTTSSSSSSLSVSQQSTKEIVVTPATTTTTTASTSSLRLPIGKRYWSIMEEGTPQERIAANEALVDYAVGTINTMLYDNSGGAYFQPHDFYDRWKHLKEVTRSRDSNSILRVLTSSRPDQDAIPADITFKTREGTVKGLKWLVSTIGDPFSKYLTREELVNELKVQNDGFLGLGAMVETPKDSINRFSFHATTVATVLPPFVSNVNNNYNNHNNNEATTMLSGTRVANLPIVTAVAPDSPAERCGIVVGDRIVAVGQDLFLGRTQTEVARILKTRYSAENYLGVAEITVAKPVVRSLTDNHDREVVIGFRPARVRVPTRSVYPYIPYSAQGLASGGDDYVHYELLTSSDSILDQSTTKVGYIRLTRFSRAATAGYVRAIEEMEAAGAQSFIIDVRNNYGGVIQEAMLTASTLLRDPHAVLCYTMNSRGGFTPHEAEEYIVDTRYPGYLLSHESKSVALGQVKRERPDIFTDHGIEWSPPSSFASIHEHAMRKSRSTAPGGLRWVTSGELSNRFSLLAQKKTVILINEGTASAAEVFASALHDNGRTVALVGTKTYGKGLIQHTFPLPDGGGLRLTVAEYLTPTLHHVTNVGNARFDQSTGEWIGGGIRPDVYCESKQGIPGKAGADLCVGMALDALEDAEAQEAESALTGQPLLRRVGGSQDGSGTRRPITAGVVRDDF